MRVDVDCLDQEDYLSSVGRVRCTSWGGRASASVVRVVNTIWKICQRPFVSSNLSCVTSMDTVDLSPIAGVNWGERTYEFSKLEYVLPVFVTALRGAIWSDCGGGKEDYLPLCFRKVC